MLRRQAITQLSLIATAILAASRVQAQNTPALKKLALLLPPAKGDYRRATSALLAGLKAAQGRDGGSLQMDVFVVDDRIDTLSNVYAEISSKGYALAVGPLPRDSVGLLADLQHVSVPTLALNWPDTDRPPVSNTIYFGLPVESDALYLAQVAFADASSQSSRRPLKASIVSASSPLARRATSAFGDAWKAQGGLLSEVIEADARLNGDQKAQLSGLESDVYFVPASIETARTVKSTLPKGSLLYGPAMLSTGVTAGNVGQTTSMRMPELDGYRVTDLPWLIQTDHPAVMSYPRQTTLSHQELQRLYALGIDAYRIARELVNGSTRFELDGVTGRLRFESSPERRVQRTPMLAEYRGGLLVPMDRI